MRFINKNFKHRNKNSLYTRTVSIFVLFLLLLSEASPVLAYSLPSLGGSPSTGSSPSSSSSPSSPIIPPTPPNPPTPPASSGGSTGTASSGFGSGSGPSSGSLCPGSSGCLSGSSSGSSGLTPSSGVDPSYITVQPFGASGNIRPDIDLSTGALNYGFKINLPEGRGGLTPDISIKYNSQDYSENSIIGFGWSLSIPSIYVNTKYGVSGNFYTSSWNKFISSLSGELVAINSNNDKFRAKIDDGSFLDYSFDFINKNWTVSDKSGKKYYFGLTNQSKQDDPSNPAGVFRYMLEKIEDPVGNSIDFYYFKDLGAIYPDHITYTNFSKGTTTQSGIYEVDFYREALTDYITQYNSAYPISTQYRINKIQVKTLGSVSGEYNLNYTNETNYIYTRSLLTSISESYISASGATTTFPTTNLTYTSGPDDGSNASQRLPGIDFEGVILSDVNGDSYTDVIKSRCVKNTSGGCDSDKAVWIYNPTTDNYDINSNWVFPGFICQDDSNGNCQGTGSALFDVSGDGLPDVVSQGSVRLNMGNGWSSSVTPASFSSLYSTSYYRPTVIDTDADGFPEVLSLYPSGGSINGLRFADYNRDGLPDMIQAHKWCCGNPGWTEGVYINNGNGSFNFNQKATDNFPADKNGLLFEDNSTVKAPAFYSVSANSFPSIIRLFGLVDVINETADAYKQSGDFNGDGMIDTVKNDPVNFNNSQAINGNKFPDLLESVSTKEGGLINYEYKASPEYKDSSGNILNKTPFPVQTVSKIKEFDPVNNLTTEKSYIYSGGYYSHDDSAFKPDSNGNYYYDKDQNYFTRKFEGFGKVEAINPDGGKTITYFHQQNGNDSSNFEENDDKSKSGKPYRIDIVDKDGTVVKKSFTKWEFATTTSLNGGAYFTYPTLSISEELDSFGGKRVMAISSTYDLSSGNKTKEIDYGEVASNSEPFNFSDTLDDKKDSDIFYSIFSSNSLISSFPYKTITKDFYNKTISETKISYDNLALGSVDRGMPTKTEKLISSVTGKYQTNEIVYNIFGNPTSKKDPNGNISSFLYDSYNLKPIQETNPKGHTRQYSYDYSISKPNHAIDENSQVYDYVFDGAGRILEEKIPDPETGLQTTKTKYQYIDIPLQSSFIKKDYLDNSTEIDSITYFDGLGRKIQERKRAEDTTSQNYSVKDYIYNSEGKLSSESLPYFGMGSLRSSPNSNLNLFINYEYDGLNRITKVSNSIGQTTTSFKVGENIITDPNGNQKIYDYDIDGNLTFVKEMLGATQLVTRYFYNSLNNLTKIRDSKGNVRNFTYDLLGRRTKAEDLHSQNDSYFGIYEYKYDSVGNLTKKTTPLGDDIIYTYDSLNRATKEDNQNTPGIEFAYSYDSCVRGVGKLCLVSSATSSTSYEYNFNDGIKKEIKFIDGATSSVEYVYGRMNNLISEKNLNLPQINYEYNNAGLLEKISYNATGTNIYILTDIDYSPSGQISYKKYANNDFENNIYDENSLYRLKTKEVKNISLSGIIQNNFKYEYSYDSVGNITSVLQNSYYDEDSNGATTTITIPALQNTGFVTSGPDTDLAWDNHHGAVDGYYINNSDNGSTTIYAGSRFDLVASYGGPIFGISRALLMFDTSAIPDDATIISATTSLTAVDYRNWNPTSESYVSLYEGINDPLLNLSLSDYSKCGDASTTPTEIGNRRQISEITTPFETNFDFPIVLNSVGLSKIKKNSYTSICLRDGHDAENVPVTIAHDVPSGRDTGGSFVFLASKDASDPLIRPSLVITYVKNPNHSNPTVSTTTYAYDSLYRLIGESIYSTSSTPVATSSYSYDELGNLLQETLSGTTTQFGYVNALPILNPYSNPHAVQSVAGQDIGYDLNGNIIKDHKGILNSWNYKNQLISSTLPSSMGTDTISYAYDSQGSRVMINSGTEKTRFFNSRHSRTLDKSNNSTSDYLHIFLGNSPIAKITVQSGTSSISYIHQDHLGSTILSTDSSGKISETAKYDPFGTLRNNKLISGTKERHKYTGHELDNQTGYTYAKARYLNTDTGRFSSEDPMFWKLSKQLLVDPQLQNSYSYAGNNPIRYVDPDGGKATEYSQLTNRIYENGAVLGSYKGTFLYTGGGLENENFDSQCLVGVQRIYNSNPYFKGSEIGGGYGTAENAYYEISNRFPDRFQKNDQGSLNMPLENDLIFWNSKTDTNNPGHVGIIAQVDFNKKDDTGFIWTIEQNRGIEKGGMFGYRFSYNNSKKGYFIDSFSENYNVLGWQHPLDPKLQTQPNYGNSTLENILSGIGSRLTEIGAFFSKNK